MSGLVFFTADDGEHGYSLWATDGTAEGTRIVRHNTAGYLLNRHFIDPDPVHKNPPDFAVLPDGRVLLHASDELFHRNQLWVSDGTPEGTVLVKQIGESVRSAPREMTVLADGRVVFSAYDGSSPDRGGTGRELWITDGTEEGTRLLKDIWPGLDELGRAQRSNPEDFHALRNGNVVFTADDGRHGRELWVTDGTQAGTEMLQDITPGAQGSEFRNFAQIADGRVIFDIITPGAPRVTWVTDGTPAGTALYEPEPETVIEGPVPPDPFQRSIGEGPYPSGVPLGLHTIDEDTALFWASGSQKLDLADLQALELTPYGPVTSLALIGDQGARVPVLFSGSDGSDYRVNTLAGPDRAVDYRADNIGSGPVSVAVGPALFAEVAVQTAQVTVSYSGANGEVSQTDSVGWSRGSWLFPSQETFEALGIGPVSVASVSAVARDENVDVNYRIAEISAGVVPLGAEWWVTDGTEAGTVLLLDINPGTGSSFPRDIHPLPQGGLIFSAFDGQERGLWSTDGTELGTKLLAAGIEQFRLIPKVDALSPEFDDKLLLSVTEGDQAGLWITDGTERGTIRLIDAGVVEMRGLSSPGMALPDGRLLIDIQQPDALAIWLVDGTVDGTRLLTTEFERGYNQIGQHVQLDADTLVFGGWDNLYKADLAAGVVETLLTDIHPQGPGYARIDHLTLALPEELRKPVSTLFDTRVTLLDTAEDSFLLHPYFSDPQGGRLGYSVEDLPEGVSFDPDTATVSAAPDAAPGRHEVTVLAESSRGGRVSDSFAWDLVDTGLLRLEPTGAWGRETRESPITLEPGGTLHIGRKDGNERLIRIEEAEATIEDGKLTVSGRLFAEQFDTELPLMQGGFTIDMATLTVSDFEDEGIEASHRLVGDLIEMQFTDLALRPEEIVLRTDLVFGDAFTAFSTEGGLLALHIDEDGPAFGLSALGTGRWFSDDALALPLPEGAPFALEFSDLGIDYDLITDSAYFSGKAELTWGETVASSYSFLSDSTTSKLVLDLAGDQEDPDSFFARGDKYLRIGKDAQGWNWDVVGEIKYEGQEGGTPAKGRPFIEEMSFSLDTVEKEFGGGFKGTLPFLFKGLTLEAEIGAKWDPVAIDSFAFGIDGLNKPLGTTGIFVQGGKLAAENLAAQDPDDWPVVSAQITMSLGPTPLAPVRGHIGGEIEGAKVTLEVEAGTKVEYLLPGEIERIAAPMIRWLGIDADDVLDFDLLKVNGAVSLDFARPTFTASVGANFLGDIITGAASFSSQYLGDELVLVNASVSAVATFPEALPLIGGLSRSGNGLAVFSSDGDNSNDFAAAWTSFSIPFYGTTSVGLRFWLDGRYEVLGRRDIEALGSWELAPELELVILSAQWENASDAARLELIAPDGTVLTEADFGADTGLAAGIALVEDLTGPTGRHVALLNPAAGIWDVRLADEAGLGAVRYEASEMLASAQATITEVTIAPGAREGVIALDLDPGDAEAVALTLFVSDTPDALSGLDVIEAVVPANEAGALSFDWDFAALASGTWWLHARAEGDGLAPQVAMFATPIEVTGAADLAVSLDQQAAAGGASVLSVTVENRGDIASGAGVLDLTVPEAVLNAPALPGADPLTAASSAIALDSLAPGESLRLDFALPAGLGPMVQPVMAEVSAAVFDADMTNNSDALFLAALSLDRAGVITTRGGALLAGAEVEATLPDGSTLTALTGPDGGFSLAGLPPGAGVVTASHGFAPGQAMITAGDALDVLRMAVGLQPSFGPAGAMDFIAADMNGDGQVTAGDALDVLRHAVGLATPNAPQWVFLDAAADLSGITAGNVAYGQGIDLSAHPAEAPLDMTAILLGNMIDPV